MPPAADEPCASTPLYDPLLAYETILECSPLNVTIYDRDLIVRDVSRAGATLAGKSRAEMRGTSLRQYLPPEYVAHTERVVAGERVEAEERLPAELCAHQPWMHVVMLPIRDAGGVVHGGMTIVVDISDQRRAEDLAEKLAFIDPVTGLANGAMFSMMLSRALSGVKGAERQLALVWVNIDRFRDVNDALGRKAGDALLKAVGDRLNERVRTNDLVARVGDDDFLLLLPGSTRDGTWNASWAACTRSLLRRSSWILSRS